MCTSSNHRPRSNSIKSFSSCACHPLTDSFNFLFFFTADEQFSRIHIPFSIPRQERQATKSRSGVLEREAPATTIRSRIDYSNQVVHRFYFEKTTTRMKRPFVRSFVVTRAPPPPPPGGELLRQSTRGEKKEGILRLAASQRNI